MQLSSIYRLIVKVMLTVFFISQASYMISQVAPATRGGGIPITAGAGFSYWDVDWAHSKMEGTTLWLDWRPPLLPRVVNGLEIEVEARDINLNPVSPAGGRFAGFREASLGGGAVYKYRRYRNIHPYIKGLMSFAGIDFSHCLDNCTTSHPYTHDTRTDYAFGGGLEYKAFRNIWARADYEYQFWPNLTGNTFLNPQGFTFGGMYDFGGRSR
jgi:opacity protein-like surface antigen